MVSFGQRLLVDLSLFFSVHNGLLDSSSSSEMKPVLLATNNIEVRFMILECSLVSLMEQISKLAKRLKSLVLAVFQPSLGCQLPVTPSLQNYVSNIVIKKSLGEAISGKTAEILGSSAFFKAVKFEAMLEGLSVLVLSLLICLDNLVLAGGMFS
ncbi:hypothetical protein G9A89_005788 [Geosiphon pyriformis]|nr:hypothetical protein G9A89_005788 [Geosiphon pyriformis]